METRRNNFKIAKHQIIEETYASMEELSKRLGGYYTCTRLLLYKMNSNLASGQTSSVGGNFFF